MPAALSKDLRERIVAAVEGGASRREAAERFAVSASSAVKLLQRWRRTGSVAPGQIGGQKRHALATHEELVRGLVAARPDATLDELRTELRGAGIAVGRTSVFRFLAAIGLTLKKRRSTRANASGPTSPWRGSPGASGRRR